LFFVSNILPDNIINQLNNEKFWDYQWELQDEQHTWKRRKLLPHDTSPLSFIDDIYLSSLPTIEESLNIKFTMQHCNSSFWLDYADFTCDIHLDGFGQRPEIAMQVYLTESEHDIGTVFYHDEHGKNVRYAFPYKINTGYIMLNNDKQWHGMITSVPDGILRLSSYTYFSSFEDK
jgi:hypothetical protein